MRTTQTTTEQWAMHLRDAGLRVTNGRLAALQFIEAHPHVSVAEIVHALQEASPSLSAQSVHNITHDLTQRGLLTKVSLPDTGSALYEIQVGNNHHHLQCISCGRIEDIDCVIGQPPCLTPNHTHGMRLIEAAITFRGVCESCDETHTTPDFSVASSSRATTDAPFTHAMSV